jgi:hypothetical protein
MLYAGGMSVREAGRFTGVSHQTMANWIEEAFEMAKGVEVAAADTDCLILQVAARRGMVLHERKWRQLSDLSYKPRGRRSCLD